MQLPASGRPPDLTVVLARDEASSAADPWDRLGLFATFWHFLTGLWVYLLVLLFLV